jgi:hypothetical protein
VALCPLGGVHLRPRLTGLPRPKRSRPLAGHPEASPPLQTLLERPMRGDLLRQPSAQMRKDAPALRLGPAAADTSLKRFTQRPLCNTRPPERSPRSARPSRRCYSVHICPRRPSVARHAGCQVVAHWQSAHAGICLGQGGAIATHRCAAQALAMLSLQL